MERLFAIVIQDGLGLPNGFVAPGGKTQIVHALVPADWAQGEFVDAGEDWPEGVLLKAEAFDRICEALYGLHWRQGNEDGSCYVIRSVDARAHHPDRAWKHQPSPDFQYHYFQADADGRVRVSDAQALQQVWERVRASR